MSIKKWNLSVKYARAFFNLYGAQLTDIDFWQIKKAAQFLTKSRLAPTYFNLHTQVERLQLNKVFLEYFKLPADFNRLLVLLQKHKRIGLLPDVLHGVAYVFLRERAKLFFELQSYPALSNIQQEQVVSYLERTTGMGILYEYRENQDLLAGIRMQSEQLLYDDTIKFRLQKIRRKLIRQN